MADVAFIGTGLLGSAMVEGMLKRGDSVTVWNRTESKARALEAAGAQVAASPGDAVAGAERVHMTLPDDAVVNDIGEGIAPRLRRDAIVIDHSTTSPRRREIADRAGPQGRHPVHPRARLHVAADGARRRRLDAGVRAEGRLRGGRGAAREDDGRGVVRRRGRRSRGRLQDVRKLDDLRHHRRRRGCVRDGQGTRDLAGRRARRVLEVPAGRRDQRPAATRWRAAISVPASS